MNWYLDAWKNYANFKGRARRKAYWMFILFNLIALAVLGLIESTIGLSGQNGYGILTGLYSLAMILPLIALAVRRLLAGRCPSALPWAYAIWVYMPRPGREK